LTALLNPVVVGRRTLPPLGLLVLALIGGCLLVVVAVNRWSSPSDEHAYWLAARRLVDGLPLYDPAATSITPFAYWYPPIVAQALVPAALVLPELAFTAIWTVLMVGCLFWLAGRNVLVALALVAFPPVAVEFWFRNVHLVLAVLIVLAIRHRPVLFAAAAAIKIAPGLGIVYLLAAGRWRAAILAAAAGAVALAGSVLLSPDAWRQFIDILASRGPGDVSGFLPIPYVLRALAGLGLAILAGRLRPRLGEPLLVVAIVVALPTLWTTALSTLVAIVPLIRTPPGEAG
jgi:alpha-1,2-mannosyltransferase